MAHSTRDTKEAPWLDALLLGGIVIAIPSACLVLLWLAWQAIGVSAAQQQPTTTPTAGQVAVQTAVLPPATPAPSATPLATHTPIPTLAPSPTLAPFPTSTYTPEPSLTPTPSSVPTQPDLVLPPVKSIVIDLSEQTLTAYENTTPVLSVLISAGLPYTPTPVGEFAIYDKLRSQTMVGPGYRLPNVEYVAYFYRSYAIHGTYWHNNFGHPMSHGCVNMTNADAQWLYAWAPIGTPVSVRQ